jgi:hypothetical protein
MSTTSHNPNEGTSHRLEYPADRVSRTRNLRPAIYAARSHYRDRFCVVAVTGAITLKSLTMICSLLHNAEISRYLWNCVHGSHPGKEEDTQDRSE